MTAAIPQCPAPGAGVHSWLLAAANRCRHRGMTPDAAERELAAAMTRPPSPANEIITSVSKAYSTTFQPTHRRSCPNARPAPVPMTALAYDPARLQSVASRIVQPRNWRHWLWERSPKRPETQNAFSFLAHLYRPGEIVLAFDKMDAKSPVARVVINQPMDCRVPDLIRAGGRPGSGIWYLSHPVDGQWHHNPRTNSMSCRSEESVSSFRYAVLESDQAPAGQWLSFVAQLPVRISALYTSGGRSIHCLIRLDAKDKAAWDNQVGPLKRPLKILGADPGALSAVRLTRLPGCHRPEKGGFQRLLYLCPDPPLARLKDLPVLRSRSAALTRWRTLCPRWNPTAQPHV